VLKDWLFIAYLEIRLLACTNVFNTHVQAPITGNVSRMLGKDLSSRMNLVSHRM